MPPTPAHHHKDNTGGSTFVVQNKYLSMQFLIVICISLYDDGIRIILFTVSFSFTRIRVPRKKQTDLIKFYFKKHLA